MGSLGVGFGDTIGGGKLLVHTYHIGFLVISIFLALISVSPLFAGAKLEFCQTSCNKQWKGSLVREKQCWRQRWQGFKQELRPCHVWRTQ
jgi:hypothetical protein